MRSAPAAPEAARVATIGRRRWIVGASATLLALAAADAAARTRRRRAGMTLCTFGDSVLDCARYNERGIDPGQLLVRNDDELFPEFRGKDLASRGPAVLEHRAVDGATVDDLEAQLQGLVVHGPAVAIVTIGGNDLLRGLAADSGPGIRRFDAALDRFLRKLPVRPVMFATVYDPTFGDDSRNFLDVPPRIARANLRRINDVIGAKARRHGRLADVHRHFLHGEPSWFTQTIEPSLIGASEVRRVFLALL